MKRIFAVLLAMMLLVGMSGCTLVDLLFPEEEEALVPPLVESAAVEFATVAVTKGDMEKTVQGTGRFVAGNSMSVTLGDTGGIIKGIYASNGMTVKQGDLLLELESGNLPDQIRAAQITVDRIELNQESALKSSNKKIRQNAEWDLELAKMNLENLEDQLKKLQVFAPMDGEIIWGTSLLVGDGIPSYTTVYTVADPDQLVIEYTGTKGIEYYKGMDVTIYTDKEASFLGKVIQDSKYTGDRALDADKRILIDSDEIPAGMFEVGAQVVVMLRQETRTGVLKLPKSAVRAYLNRTYVQVLVDGVRVEKDVVVGLDDGTDLEIISGLSLGEEVILR